MPSDPAFCDAGQRPGLEIWRIEQFKVVPYPKENYGKFYNGDAFIVLASFGPKLPTRWNVHFWLGKDSTQDEQGTAAIKAVELDELIGGMPVQYREVQNHESKQFLSYFRNGIKYLKGGVASGFTHVDKDAFEKSMYHIKGKRNCRISQVEASVAALNKGDVFILDCGDTIYVWNGPKSSHSERIKGAAVARQMRDEERGGKAAVILIDDDWECNKDFYAELDAPIFSRIAEAEKAGLDDVYEKRVEYQMKLFRFCDENGQLEINEIKERPLRKEHLDTKDCFIIDLATTGIYAWVGKDCSKREKDDVWQKAQSYLKRRNLPDWTPIRRVVEGAEPTIIKNALQWPMEMKTPETLHVVTAGGVAQTNDDEQVESVASMHYRGERVTSASAVDSQFMPDDGSGECQIWRVENFEPVPLDESDFGTFYNGDSYVLLYKYGANGQKGVVYFWQGSRSSLDEKAAAAMLAQQFDEREMNGRAVQIRVVEGKEPAHFLKVLHNRLITLMGGCKSGFQLTNHNENYDETQVRLFRVRNNRVMQIKETASQLNSNDVFLLESPNCVYLWYGKGSNEEERQASREFAKVLAPSKNPIVTDEGEEAAAFWQHLGGRDEYATGGTLLDVDLDRTAFLFHCSNARGYFHVEEVVDYTQEDLVDDDVMLLDAWFDVFIWVGKGANEVEKKEAMSTALQYIQTDPLGRSTDNTNMYVIKQGSEIPAFTGHFPNWDPDWWKASQWWSKQMTYPQIKAELERQNAAMAVRGAKKTTTVEEALSLYEKTYPLSALMDNTQLPEGVDPAKKEYHLSDGDFLKAFGKTKAEYDALASWKRIELKKKVGLF